MKKVLLIALALGIGMSTLFAQKQKKVDVVPENLKNIKAVKIHGALDLPKSPLAAENPYVAPQLNETAKTFTFNSITESVIGQTKYDLQTNVSVQNRIYVHPDGTIGATWTYGLNNPAFSDRGTGYNYYDGTAWGTQPTSRIETQRCGWPSYCPLPSDGELVISHKGSIGLIVSKRSPKGTGSWTESMLNGPAASNGSTALLWPRVCTSGNTIHVIACTEQAASGSTPITYQGLQLALVYIRSTDGGATWDAPQILPGMDSASVVATNNKGFGGDGYAWALPKGDTVALVCGSDWGGVFIMKSFNNGNTWTKIPVFTFPTITADPTGRIPTIDGSVAIALDNLGKAHICTGRMYVSDSIITDDQSSYYPYTDGLIYWKEGMPVIDTTLLSDVNALYTGGNLIGYMLDWDNDSIEWPQVAQGERPFGDYYLSLSSMPQIAISNDNIYVTYSSCMENKVSTGATPNEQMYRHILFTKSNDLGNTWDTTIVDLNSDVLHDYDECIFGSLAYHNNKLYMVYQADLEPGLAVRGDEDAYADNYIYCMYWNPAGSGINENFQTIDNINIYPNPSNDYSFIDLNLNQTQNVELIISNIVGQQVLHNSYGKLAAGKYTLSVESNKLTTGVYLYTVKAGNNSFTHKMIIE